MPSVRIENDGGDVINIDGVIYTKASGQPSMGDITAVPTTTNITEYTWKYDDSRVDGGSNHRTWTAEEMAVCAYGTGNQGYIATVEVPYQLIFTAPSPGIIRVWIISSAGLRIQINSTSHTDEYYKVVANMNESQAFGLNTGDEVNVRCDSWRSVYSRFLPLVYP